MAMMQSTLKSLESTDKAIKSSAERTLMRVGMTEEEMRKAVTESTKVNKTTEETVREAFGAQQTKETNQFQRWNTEIGALRAGASPEAASQMSGAKGGLQALAKQRDPQGYKKHLEIYRSHGIAQEEYLRQLEAQKQLAEQTTSTEKKITQAKSERHKITDEERRMVRSGARFSSHESRIRATQNITGTAVRGPRGMAVGGSFVTSGPELIFVGESGAERVTVEPSAGGAQPIPPGGIRETMMREKTSVEAGTPTLKSDELAGIEDASKQQVDQLGQVVEGILELVGIMKPGSSVIGAATAPTLSTQNNTLPVQSPQYGSWKFGKPGGTTNRNLINDGM
jgi:hypothetical protein